MHEDVCIDAPARRRDHERVESRVSSPRPLVVASSSSSSRPRASSASPRRRDSNGRLLLRLRPRHRPPPSSTSSTTTRRRRRGFFEPLNARGTIHDDGRERTHARTNATTTARERPRVEDAHAPCTYTTPLARQQTNGQLARDAREAMTRESRGITRGGWSYLH